MIHDTTRKERRIEHYSNRQKILLVGEGDFSFAACLAYYFLDASNIVATSLDSRGQGNAIQVLASIVCKDAKMISIRPARVIRKYSKGERNLRDLEERGGVVIHGVDAHTMNNHPRLRGLRFDTIVFNFPHVGDTTGHPRPRRPLPYSERSTCYIQRHRHLVRGFLRAARKMVEGEGEIHVTHKTTHPFDKWRVADMAKEAGLELRREVDFSRWNYPGYDNKKAYGRSWDLPFRVGDSSTFVFCLPSSSVWYRLSRVN